MSNAGVKEFNLLQETISKITEMLDEEMNIFLEPVPLFLREILSYYYSQGGKRLRPALLLAVANAFGSKENLAPFALTIELIHTMSLYHDDVIDDAKERRGVPTVHERWNAATAIVGGDIFHAVIHLHILRAIQTNRVTNKDIAMRFLVDLIQIAELKVGAAVIEEMRMAESSKIPSLEASIEVTAGKTAPLFAFCATAGAYLAEQDPEIVEDMNEMGKKIGYAFQLLDDLLDYFESDKDIGGDLREDKKTPLLVLAHHKDPKKVESYRRQKEKLTREDIIRFRSEFTEEIKQILDWALKEIKESRQLLVKIPENEGKILINALFTLLENKTTEFSNQIENN